MEEEEREGVVLVHEVLTGRAGDGEGRDGPEEARREAAREGRAAGDGTRGQGEEPPDEEEERGGREGDPCGGEKADAFGEGEVAGEAAGEEGVGAFAAEGVEGARFDGVGPGDAAVEDGEGAQAVRHFDAAEGEGAFEDEGEGGVGGKKAHLGAVERAADGEGREEDGEGEEEGNGGKRQRTESHAPTLPFLRPRRNA